MAQYLTMEQIAYYASRAGFTGEALQRAVAIAWAESGGRIDASGDSGNSGGLWQIYAPAHPGVDQKRVRSDPAYAAEQAFRISGGGKNFGPWTTWSHTTTAGRTHQAQQFLSQAATAIAGMQAASAQGGSINTTPRTTPGTATSAAGTTIEGVGVNSGQMGPSTASVGGNITVGADGTLSLSQVDELPDDATPEQIEAYIRKTYPQAAPFLANEEIRRILLRPDIDDMDATEVEALLRGTNYWKTHSAASRAYDALIGTDGNEAGRITDKAISNVTNAVSKLGLAINPADIPKITKNLIRSGVISLDGTITDTQGFNQAIVFLNGKGGGQVNAGEVAGNADKLIQQARQYLVPISRGDAEEWVRRMATGSASQESFTSWLTGLAKARFASQPDILAALEAGLPPSSYFAGHRTTVAGILELDDGQIDLMDPKWSWMVEKVDDKGNRRAPTLGEVQMEARQRPEFANTQAYRSTSAEYSLGLAKFIGKAG